MIKHLNNHLIHRIVAALDSDCVDQAIEAVISGPGTKSSNVGD
jgi:hypothetical protein